MERESGTYFPRIVKDETVLEVIYLVQVDCGFIFKSLYFIGNIFCYLHLYTFGMT